MKTHVVFALCLVVAGVLAGGCQSTPTKGHGAEGWATQIAGTYKGGMWGGETKYPGTTTFSVGANGALKGTYELDENGTAVPGKLSNCRVVGPRQLACRWEDKNGAGDLAITFTENLSQFDGFWTLDGDPQKHRWNGTR